MLGTMDKLQAKDSDDKKKADELITRYKQFRRLPKNDDVHIIYNAAIQAYNQGQFGPAIVLLEIALMSYDFPQSVMNKLKILQPGVRGRSRISSSYRQVSE